MLKICIFLALINLCLASFYYDDVLKLIRNAGYKGESHQVKPSDGGWILKVHRILPKAGSPRRQFPIFLMHGLIATSADYVVTGRNKALAYLLADNGYDVWLGNARGNRHAVIDKSTVKYKNLWKFSFHEMGFYDLPAMIDYMLNIANANKAFYVGHSQGTSALIVMLSLRPEYNDKIIQAHLFAPVAFMKYFQNRILRAINQPAYELFENNKIEYLDLSSVIAFGSSFGKVFCNQAISPGTTMLCKGLIYAIVGVNTYQEELDETILPDITNHISSCTSAKQLQHYSQIITSGRFRQYDYKQRNKVIYNMTEPPDYPISNIYADIYAYRAPEDLLSSKRDIEHLLSLLPNVKYYRTVSNFNHVDFTYGKRSRKVLYEEVLNFVNKYENAAIFSVKRKA